MNRHAAFGERERLIVTVLEHHHTGLIPTDRGHDIIGVNSIGQPFGLAERGHRLFVVALLRERNSGQGMYEREMPPVAGGEQRRGRLRDVFADDRDVADLPIALTELVVGEPDGARIVSDLGLLEGPTVMGDRARLIAPSEGQPSVQPPQGRQAGR